MNRLPLDADDAAIARWVEGALAALDTTPRRRDWRRRALGRPRNAVMAEAERERTVSMGVPITEVRVWARAARAKGLTTQGYIRAAVCAALEADGIDTEGMPWTNAKT